MYSEQLTLKQETCMQPFDRVLVGMTELQETEQGFTANFGGLSLSSAFQPIYSVAHRKAVGYEGLLRAYDVDGHYVPPGQVMQMPQSNREHLELDRSCRLLHTQNFSVQENESCWLFLNLNSQCLVAERPDEGFMRSLMAQTGLPARRIVIEILESEISDRAYLKELITHFRKLGCLIAIDDFGAGHSNFDRVWELQPDIVKIDRNLVKQAGISLKAERILTGIVSLIHEVGSLVVVEGVENEQEALVAISSNADMVQGFYFARPAAHVLHDQRFADTIDALLARQQSLRSQYNRKMQQHFDNFRERYAAEVFAFSGGQAFEQCGREVFDDERVVRCYLLDERGYQIGKSQYSPQYTARLDIRHAPLLAGENANWSHRHYHYRAIQNPGVMQISRPYLSVAGSHMCITVSQAVTMNGKTFVFCCDLDWADEAC
jgi:EAL domain-containing protein (putative c-di-GMP-specific phosphodiesterase class I)